MKHDRCLEHGAQMIGSLRKGLSSAYFQHEMIGHNIGAEKFECEVRNRMVIVRFSLRPGGGNQLRNQQYVHTHPFTYVEISDIYLIDNLRSYLHHHQTEFPDWLLEIHSFGKLLS